MYVISFQKAICFTLCSGYMVSPAVVLASSFLQFTATRQFISVPLFTNLIPYFLLITLNFYYRAQ